MIKRIMLFLLFPERGFRTNVTLGSMPRWKVCYAAMVNLGFPLLFLICGLMIMNNQPLKERLQVVADTEISEKVDDYLRYAPIPFIFILDRVGFAPATPFWVRATVFGSAYVLGDLVTYRTKKLTQVERPMENLRERREDGTLKHPSFPSQHTMQGFLAATALHHEFVGSKGGVAVSAAGMLTAGTVGYLRFARDKHWSSDVLVGAAVGMFAVNIVYLFLLGLVTRSINRVRRLFNK